MAGYCIYALDGEAFGKLVSTPTDEQARVFAKCLAKNYPKELSDSQWPQDVASLTPKIKEILASSDWYDGLNDSIIDRIAYLILDEEIRNELEIELKLSDYGSIYWDCADIAAAQGATMMREPVFGATGFRYNGDLENESGNYNYRNYSIFTPEQVSELLGQLENVESHFDSLPNSVSAPFFLGLLAPVEYAAENKHFIFVQTDT